MRGDERVLWGLLEKMVNEMDFYYVPAEKQTVGCEVYILPVQSQCECKSKHSKDNIQLQNNIKHLLTFKIYLEDQYFYFSTKWLPWITDQLFWVFSKCLACRDTTINKIKVFLAWHAEQQ